MISVIKFMVSISSLYILFSILGNKQELLNGPCLTVKSNAFYPVGLISMWFLSHVKENMNSKEQCNGSEYRV